MKTRSDETAPAWTGNWEKRIHQRISERGYGTYQGYLLARRGHSYEDMARELSKGEDIAPVQLARLHARCVESGNRRDAILDSFARYLRGVLKKGWRLDKHWESAVAGALSSWYVTWEGGAELDALQREVFLLHPEPGWIPQDSQDPILREAARRAW